MQPESIALQIEKSRRIVGIEKVYQKSAKLAKYIAPMTLGDQLPERPVEDGEEEVEDDEEGVEDDEEGVEDEEEEVYEEDEVKEEYEEEAIMGKENNDEKKNDKDDKENYKDEAPKTQELDNLNCESNRSCTRRDNCSLVVQNRGQLHELDASDTICNFNINTCGYVMERRNRRFTKMARLVKMYVKEDEKDMIGNLGPKQLPLKIDEYFTMVMDITGLKALRESPMVQGKQLEEFTKKYNLLTPKERRISFAVACKEILSVVDQTVPCIGCRRSVERLFFDLTSLPGHPALDPIIITFTGTLSIRPEVLQSPQILCTLLQGHSTRLNELVDRQPRNKKSRRCVLHSLEVQRMRPPQNAWREVWDCLEFDCLKEITLIDNHTLNATLDTYLRKHKFCSDCRTKVLLASALLTTKGDPTKEKGYVSSLYADLTRCTKGHVHLPMNTEYIGSLIGRAQPDLIGRERHAKTLEIAQEEVLTCLGICIAERLNRIYRRLKEEETMVKVLAAVAVDTLSRSFQMAVDYKQGITQLEVLYKEFKREEVAKQQRREKLRLKKKQKKERRAELEGKENQSDTKENKCECPQIEAVGKEIKDSTEALPPKPELERVTHNDRHKLQILDPKMKGPPTCNCADCAKKTKNTNQAQVSNQSATSTPNKKDKKNKKKKVESKAASNSSNINAKKGGKREKMEKSNICKDLDETSAKFLEINKSCDQHYSEVSKRVVSHDECKNPSPTVHLMENVQDKSKNCTMWIEVKKRLNTKALHRKVRSSSDNSSQIDYGYSSEHNTSSSSSSSSPSTPEGSEVACSEGCCGHEGDCPDARSMDKLNLSDTSLCLFKEYGGGLTLLQMLEDNSEDDGNLSYIPAEDVLEFKSRMCQVTEKRRELRQTLQKRFAALCNSHHKPFTIPR